MATQKTGDGGVAPEPLATGFKITGGTTTQKVLTVDVDLTASAVATVSDTAYGAGWDGVTTVAPSKNVVYDKISTMGYVDRGDPAAYDLEQGAMTMDNAWHDWDLSSIVPAGATAVNLVGLVQYTAAGNALFFRRNGNTNQVAMPGIFSQVANVSNYSSIIVACDASRIIEYKATVSFTAISLVIIGWWI